MSAISNAALIFCSENNFAVAHANTNKSIYIHDVFCAWLQQHRAITCRRIIMKAALRDYQEEAAQCGRNGGVIIIPCGGGKTMVGMRIAQLSGGPSLVCVVNSVSAEQWKQHILSATNLTQSDVIVLDEKCKWTAFRTAVPTFVISTYMMLTGDVCHSPEVDKVLSVIRAIPFDSVICDEVHLAVAIKFQRVFSMRTTVVVGLTATWVREDNNIHERSVLGVVYHKSVASLVAQGHISRVTCTTLALESGTRDANSRESLACKIQIVLDLLQKHRDHKVCFFCDDVWIMKLVAGVVEKLSEVRVIGPMSMDTNHDIRVSFIEQFKRSRGGVIMVMAKVGDLAIDITSSVGIQFNCNSRSRMQEGQRIGRCQRYNQMGGSYWYSIVAQQELAFRERRNAYLDELGYSNTIEYVQFHPDPHVIREVDARMHGPKKNRASTVRRSKLKTILKRNARVLRMR